jgi:hypothetical protein
MNARLAHLGATVERRILVNFRADPDAVRRLLPEPFTPQIVGGVSMVGMCLIRLGGVRPPGVPRALGLSSEHVAHRIAVVVRNGSSESLGVYIPRRDTDSRIAAAASRFFFSAPVHLADFTVHEDGEDIRIAVSSRDGAVDIAVDGRSGSCLPATSVFPGADAASQFFRTASAGYSDGATPGRYDGVRLAIPAWSVRAFDVREARSSLFADPALFPPGSVEFDSALLMQRLESAWEALPPLQAA